MFWHMLVRGTVTVRKKTSSLDSVFCLLYCSCSTLLLPVLRSGWLLLVNQLHFVLWEVTVLAGWNSSVNVFPWVRLCIKVPIGLKATLRTD